MDTEAKVYENRVRREAARQGYGLVKSKSRNSDDPGYGKYMITDGRTHVPAAGVDADGKQTMNLDDAFRFLAASARECRRLIVSVTDRAPFIRIMVGTPVLGEGFSGDADTDNIELDDAETPILRHGYGEREGWSLFYIQRSEAGEKWVESHFIPGVLGEAYSAVEEARKYLQGMDHDQF